MNIKKILKSLLNYNDITLNYSYIITLIVTLICSLIIVTTSNSNIHASESNMRNSCKSYNSLSKIIADNQNVQNSDSQQNTNQQDLLIDQDYLDLAQSELVQSELAQSELAQSELVQSELVQSELVQQAQKNLMIQQMPQTQAEQNNTITNSSDFLEEQGYFMSDSVIRKGLELTKKANLYADNIEFDFKTNMLVITGNVKFLIKDSLTVSADEVIYYSNSRRLHFKGNVNVYSSHLGSMKSSVFNIYLTDEEFDAKEVTILNKSGSKVTTKTIKGSLKKGVFRLKEAKYTLCESSKDKRYSWLIKSDYMNIVVRPNKKAKYLHLEKATVSILNMSVLYLPFFNFRIDSSYRSGFLYPGLKNSLAGKNMLFWPITVYLSKGQNFTYTPSISLKYKSILHGTEYTYSTENTFLQLSGNFIREKYQSNQTNQSKLEQTDKQKKIENQVNFGYNYKIKLRKKFENYDLLLDYHNISDRDFLLKYDIDTTEIYENKAKAQFFQSNQYGYVTLRDWLDTRSEENYQQKEKYMKAKFYYETNNLLQKLNKSDNYSNKNRYKKNSKNNDENTYQHSDKNKYDYNKLGYLRWFLVGQAEVYSVKMPELNELNRENIKSAKNNTENSTENNTTADKQNENSQNEQNNNKKYLNYLSNGASFAVALRYRKIFDKGMEIVISPSTQATYYNGNYVMNELLPDYNRLSSNEPISVKKINSWIEQRKILNLKTKMNLDISKPYIKQTEKLNLVFVPKMKILYYKNFWSNHISTVNSRYLLNTKITSTYVDNIFFANTDIQNNPDHNSALYIKTGFDLIADFYLDTKIYFSIDQVNYVSQVETVDREVLFDKSKLSEKQIKVMNEYIALYHKKKYTDILTELKFLLNNKSSVIVKTAMNNKFVLNYFETTITKQFDKLNSSLSIATMNTDMIQRQKLKWINNIDTITQIVENKDNQQSYKNLFNINLKYQVNDNISIYSKTYMKSDTGLLYQGGGIVYAWDCFKIDFNIGYDKSLWIYNKPEIKYGIDLTINKY